MRWKNLPLPGASIIQIVDIDAARSKESNNEALIKEMIGATHTPVQVSGGIKTLNQINDWFESGAARVVLGTVAITDFPLVVEAANHHPGGVIVHLVTRDGYVVIDGWKTQTAFRPEDILRELQVTGIAGVIHKATEVLDGNFIEELALTEATQSGGIYTSVFQRHSSDVGRYIAIALPTQY